ncbi:tRNA wybutosine-synthesizing protein 3 homolog [Diadema antillarum]|uniref:tRNA wybutosine-synthesizing protein 3 homolog n=1 Tax=Diadema antillarum TaxID=105358 RepID=UPI003A8AD156
MAFQRIKESRLKSADLSRKGNIDEEIVGLVELINQQEHYFTTSSCSGRTIVVCENSDDTSIKKKGCRWLFVTHKWAHTDEVMSALKGTDGSAVLKFEPFVLHVQCQSIDKARIMHQSAVASGFRNSGITIGNGGKVMTAVRSTHGLEVPLTDGGTLLVSEEYIKFVVNLANKKMKENFTRIQRFFDNLKRVEVSEDTKLVKISSSKTTKSRILSDRLASSHQQDKAVQTVEHTPARHTSSPRVCVNGVSGEESRLDTTETAPGNDSMSRTEDPGGHASWTERDSCALLELEGFSAMFAPSDEDT